MSLTIAIEPGVSITVVCPKGRLDGTGAPLLESQCTELIDGGASRLIIDMEGIEYISSAGLRCILIVAKKTKAAGGAVALCSLTELVGNVVTMSGFDNFLTVAPDRDAATAALANPA